MLAVAPPRIDAADRQQLVGRPRVGARVALERHARAYPRPADELLPVGGIYAWRRDGEHHMWNPETIALVQHEIGRAACRERGLCPDSVILVQVQRAEL